MKRLSLRLWLMFLMICLIALPVVTVTWIATYNTRTSVEKELIGANQSNIGRVKFLGYGFYPSKDGIKLRVHAKSISKMKARIKELTARSNGLGFAQGN